jgi:hypothetical protein
LGLDERIKEPVPQSGVDAGPRVLNFDFEPFFGPRRRRETDDVRRDFFIGDGASFGC